MGSKNFEIAPSDWQVFAVKLLALLPGKNSGDRHKWLANKTGISPSTSQNWTRKNGEGSEGERPSIFNLEKIAELLDTPLSQLIVIVQQQIDPPVPYSRLVSAEGIAAIASVDRSELEMTAQSLSGITQAEIYEAMANLAIMAQLI